MKFRDFVNSEISRILKFRDFDDFEIPRFLRNYSAVMNREKAVREARGRVFRTRFRMPNHARDTPHPPRSKLGKFENFHMYVGVDFLRVSQFVNFVSFLEFRDFEILRIQRFRGI